MRIGRSHRPALLPLLVVLLTAVAAAGPGAAQEASGDAEGCCQVPAGCTELTRSQCAKVEGGRFFEAHECSSGPKPECVLVHPVSTRADFQMRLFRGEEPPLQGSVGLLGETKVTRSSLPGEQPITIEIVEMELSGSPPSFGPMDFRYEETEPPSGSLDLDTGGFQSRLLGPELQLYEPVPLRIEVAEFLFLETGGVSGFPPVGATLEAQGGPFPLVSGSEVVGEVDDFSLSFPAGERPDCCPGPVPAATLLVPYFEVDLDDVAGPTTLFTVTNGGDAYVLARVLLWTDLGVPTLGFHVYLSPSDVQSFNLRDLLAGHLPDTSAVLADPQRPILDFDPCQAAELAPSLSAAQVDALRAAHLGAPDPVSGLCSGRDHGDAVARGYVTVDTVRTCAFPPTVRSHQHGADLFDRFELSGQNVLWGDYIYIDGGNDFAQSEAAVHRAYDPLAFDPGDYTFYGRYSSFDGSDALPALAGRYRVRFLQGGPFSGGARLVVWRDNLSDDMSPRLCGTPAPWQPLGDGGVVVYDEEENAVPMGSLSAVCPGAAGVSFACDLTGLPFPFGFLDVDLSHGDGRAAQASVVTVLRADGRYSVANRAVPVGPCGGEAPLQWLERTDTAVAGSCEASVVTHSGQCPVDNGDVILLRCGSAGGCPELLDQRRIRLCPEGECDWIQLLITDDTCEDRGSVDLFQIAASCP